jgi:RNA polymerase sigma factor (sigma-70 family)
MDSLSPKPTARGNFPAKDKSTFTYLFKTCYGALCALAVKIVKCYEKARDTVSAVFARFWEKWDSFESVQKMKYWLYIATRYASLNAYKRNRFEELSQKVIDSLLTDEDGQHIMNREKLLDQVAVAITNLSQQDQRIFKLAYVYNRPNEEIAKRLKISYQTVANRKTAAFSLIRKHLRAHRLSKE